MKLGWPTSTFHVATSLCTLQFTEIPFFCHLDATFAFLTSMLTGVAKRDLNSISSFYDCFRISWKLVCLVLIWERVLEQWTIPFLRVYACRSSFSCPKGVLWTHRHSLLLRCCVKSAVNFSHLCLFRTKLESLFLIFRPAAAFVRTRVSSFSVLKGRRPIGSLWGLVDCENAEVNSRDWLLLAGLSVMCFERQRLISRHNPILIATNVFGSCWGNGPL